MHYELALLSAIGYGLDLTQCASNQSKDNLCYVSPRTGHAVSQHAGTPYHDKLLPLPAFLRPTYDSSYSENIPNQSEMIDASRLSGYFLIKHVLKTKNHDFLQDRQRFLQYVHKQGNKV